VFTADGSPGSLPSCALTAFSFAQAAIKIPVKQISKMERIRTG
jgi:hypothetical protein